MQLKKSYYIDTNVCSRKSATTFGDIPDWLEYLQVRCLWQHFSECSVRSIEAAKLFLSFIRLIIDYILHYH